MSLLKDRINEAIADWKLSNNRKFKDSDFAKKCGVARQTVGDWRHGRSNSISGEPLLLAAKELGLRPEWLAAGSLPKRSNDREISDVKTPYSIINRNTSFTPACESTDTPLPELDSAAVAFALQGLDLVYKKEVMEFNGIMWTAEKFTKLYRLAIAKGSDTKISNYEKSDLKTIMEI